MTLDRILGFRTLGAGNCHRFVNGRLTGVGEQTVEFLVKVHHLRQMGRWSHDCRASRKCSLLFLLGISNRCKICQVCLKPAHTFDILRTWKFAARCFCRIDRALVQRIGGVCGGSWRRGRILDRRLLCRSRRYACFSLRLKRYHFLQQVGVNIQKDGDTCSFSRSRLGRLRIYGL